MERKCNNLLQKYNARVAETEKTSPSNVNANLQIANLEI